MTDRPVIYRPKASDDLQAIYNHIARDSPQRALGYVERLRSHCDALSQFPERGRLRNDLAQGVRLLTFEKSAVIAYRAEDERVLIINIFYRGRDYETLLNEQAN